PGAGSPGGARGGRGAVGAGAGPVRGRQHAGTPRVRAVGAGVRASRSRRPARRSGPGRASPRAGRGLRGSWHASRAAGADRGGAWFAAPPAGPGGRAPDRAGACGPAPARQPAFEPGDRPRTLRLGQHHQEPCPGHLSQVGGRDPGRGDRPRARARPDIPVTERAIVARVQGSLGRLAQLLLVPLALGGGQVCAGVVDPLAGLPWPGSRIVDDERAQQGEGLVADGASQGGERVRTAEVIAALSLATDLGIGVPLEHGLQSALLAMRLGERLGVDQDTASQTYYACLLFYVGCTADAEVAAETFGDDGALTTSALPARFGSKSEMTAGIMRALATSSSPAPVRAMHIARGMPRAARE